MDMLPTFRTPTSSPKLIHQPTHPHSHSHTYPHPQNRAYLALNGTISETETEISVETTETVTETTRPRLTKNETDRGQARSRPRVSIWSRSRYIPTLVKTKKKPLVKQLFLSESVRSTKLTKPFCECSFSTSETFY
jgi:hypothetical protein